MNLKSCKNRLYRIRHNMKSRCLNKNCHNRKYYGGKGIKICEERSNDFETFEKRAIDNGYRENLQIDRLDNTKGYEPSNCRWVNKFDQEHNKTTNKFITYNGETKTISDWARKYNIHRCLLGIRLRRGWSFEEAIKGGHRRK